MTRTQPAKKKRRSTSSKPGSSSRSLSVKAKNRQRLVDDSSDEDERRQEKTTDKSSSSSAEDSGSDADEIKAAKKKEERKRLAAVKKKEELQKKQKAAEREKKKEVEATTKAAQRDRAASSSASSHSSTKRKRRQRDGGDEEEKKEETEDAPQSSAKNPRGVRKAPKLPVTVAGELQLKRPFDGLADGMHMKIGLPTEDPGSRLPRNELALVHYHYDQDVGDNGDGRRQFLLNAMLDPVNHADWGRVVIFLQDTLEVPLDRVFYWKHDEIYFNQKFAIDFRNDICFLYDVIRAFVLSHGEFWRPLDNPGIDVNRFQIMCTEKRLMLQFDCALRYTHGHFSFRASQETAKEEYHKLLKPLSHIDFVRWCLWNRSQKDQDVLYTCSQDVLLFREVSVADEGVPSSFKPDEDNDEATEIPYLWKESSQPKDHLMQSLTFYLHDAVEAVRGIGREIDVQWMNEAFSQQLIASVIGSIGRWLKHLVACDTCRVACVTARTDKNDEGLDLLYSFLHALRRLGQNVYMLDLPTDQRLPNQEAQVFFDERRTVNVHYKLVSSVVPALSRPLGGHGNDPKYPDNTKYPFPHTRPWHHLVGSFIFDPFDFLVDQWKNGKKGRNSNDEGDNGEGISGPARPELLPPPTTRSEFAEKTGRSTRGKKATALAFEDDEMDDDYVPISLRSSSKRGPTASQTDEDKSPTASPHRKARKVAAPRTEHVDIEPADEVLTESAHTAALGPKLGYGSEYETAASPAHTPLSEPVDIAAEIDDGMGNDGEGSSGPARPEQQLPPTTTRNESTKKSGRPTRAKKPVENPTLSESTATVTDTKTSTTTSTSAEPIKTKKKKRSLEDVEENEIRKNPSLNPSTISLGMPELAPWAPRKPRKSHKAPPSSPNAFPDSMTSTAAIMLSEEEQIRRDLEELDNIGYADEGTEIPLTATDEVIDPLLDQIDEPLFFEETEFWTIPDDELEVVGEDEEDGGGEINENFMSYLIDDNIPVDDDLDKYIY